MAREKMKYNQSKDESAEYLRLALPFMAAHRLSVNPINYAISYEYVAGINAKLTEAFDSIIAKGVTISDELGLKLYRSFIAVPGVEKLSDVQDKFAKTLLDTQDLTEKMQKRTQSYGESLQNCLPQLRSSNTDEGLLEIVDGLVKSTESVQNANAAMSQELAEKSMEIEQLKADLNVAKVAAQTDPMTGLKNRRQFTHDLDEKIALAEKEKPLSMLMLDIDHFKKFNDTYGHVFGDKVIKAVAQSMVRQVKGRDTVARVGGEEFAVLLPDTDERGAVTVAEMIRHSIEQIKLRRSDSSDPVDRITISVGATQYCEGESCEQLIKRADDALYESKSNGRNRVTFKDSLT